MVRYLVIEIATQKSQAVERLGDAAHIVGLDPADVERALEEQGVCETDHHTVETL